MMSYIYITCIILSLKRLSYFCKFGCIYRISYKSYPDKQSHSSLTELLRLLLHISFVNREKENSLRYIRHASVSNQILPSQHCGTDQQLIYLYKRATIILFSSLNWLLNGVTKGVRLLFVEVKCGICRAQTANQIWSSILLNI